LYRIESTDKSAGMATGKAEMLPGVGLSEDAPKG